MNYKLHKINGTEIIEIKENSVIIKDTQDILDIIANLHSRKFILYKKNINENFFNLKTGLAGEILQKASNYSIQIGIVGDFSKYKSKSLQAFMFESNKTNQIIFVRSLDDALQKFS